MKIHSTTPLQITDRFGAQAAFASLRLPDGTEAAVPTEHAAALYVNEQPAFRVVCTPELLPQLALGRLLTEGWIASAGEVEQCRSLHGGRRPVGYARDMGLLNERAVLAHMVDVTDEELELVAASGAAVVHNPVSNLKLASGFARVRDMVQAGVPVSLGTDGACSNNSLDMFETMKLAAILAKGYSGDATALPAMQALKMATAEGARIFRTPGLGTLVPGAPADMIALNLDEPNLCPMFNETSHAVYASSGKDCVFTMVEGKILYDHGIYTDGLYADTAAEMRDLVEWVKGGNDS